MSSYPAKVTVLTHANDNFETGPYVLSRVVESWKKIGIDVRILRGIGRFEAADALILHVNLTIVPDTYLDFCRQYPVVINGGVQDISKRKISSHLVSPQDFYCGPVIVKTNRNFGGAPERMIAQQRFLHRLISRVKRRLPWSWTGYLHPQEYPVFASSRDVPHAVWRNPHLVVEKFLPEREGHYYCLRNWIFFGDREVNRRVFSTNPIVKARNTTHHEDGFPVPGELRALRAKLRFDYGKFDYTLVNGETVLCDANHTPGIRQGILTPRQAFMVEELAQGLFSFFTKNGEQQETGTP